MSVAIWAQDFCVLSPLAFFSFREAAAGLRHYFDNFIMTAMEPTAIEVQSFNNLADVLTWAGFDVQKEGDESPSARSTLLALLGLKPADGIRVVGYISQDRYLKALEGWRVDGRDPNFSESSMGELFGSACRIACGRDLRAEEARKQATRAAEATDKPSVSAAPPGKRIKLSTVADQANDGEVTELDAASVTAAYARFEALTGGAPEPHEELTLDQLSSLHSLLHGTTAPYVDFAVWGPYGHRIAKKVRMTGLVIGHHGELKPVEIFGPACVEDWEQCFHVFRTGCLMLNAVALGTLDRYRDLIKYYSARYSGKVWVIIYQADVRARLEHIERMKRRGMKLVANGASTGERPFVAERPWDWSFAECVADHGFWKRELEEPALLVLSRAGSLNHMVDGDATTAAGSMQAASAPRHGGSGSGGGSGGGGGGGGGGPAPAKKKNAARDRQHSVDPSGCFTHNRRGTRLCPEFQTGHCGTGAANEVCKDRLAHQCHKCLAQGHIGSGCSRTASKPSSLAKGKGRGKGKDKGGSRHQY
jgi:hypothetical protein